MTEQQLPASILKVMRAVARDYDVRLSDIRGPLQTVAFTVPRQLVCYILVREMGYSFPHVGRFLLRHHSTILASVRRVDRTLKSDRAAVAYIGRLMAELNVKDRKLPRGCWSPPPPKEPEMAFDVRSCEFYPLAPQMRLVAQ